MAGDSIEIRRLFDAKDLQKGSFEFTGHESRERYQAKKSE